MNLTSLDPQPLKSGTALEFTFSVEWEANTIPFARRFERYLDYSFFEHQVRAGLLCSRGCRGSAAMLGAAWDLRMVPDIGGIITREQCALHSSPVRGGWWAETAAFLRSSALWTAASLKPGHNIEVGNTCWSTRRP